MKLKLKASRVTVWPRARIPGWERKTDEALVAAVLHFAMGLITPAEV